MEIPKLPVGNTKLRVTPNKEMARTLSRQAAAMIKVGIPFSSPYPLSRSSSKRGTTTAGETGAKTNL